MNSSAPLTAPFFGDITIAHLSPADTSIGLSPIEYRVLYINNLPVPVTIGWRSGFKFKLPSKPSLHNNTLIARIEIRTDASVRADIHRELSKVDENSSTELKALKEAFYTQLTENYHGGTKLILDYPINLNQLTEYGGSVYYHELDTVISVEEVCDMPPHPYSEEGLKTQAVVNMNDARHSLGFGYTIAIVDNLGKFGDRFINVANRVIKVVAQHDIQKRDGVYVHTNGFATNGRDPTKAQVEIISLDVAEEHLGLHKTYAEALNSPDALAQRKEKIAEMEYEGQVLRTNLQNAKTLHDTQMLEKEQQIKELERVADQKTRELKMAQEKADYELTLERTRLKDEYDRRSYERKDHSESIKFLPMLVIGVGSVFMAFKTFFGH